MKRSVAVQVQSPRVEYVKLLSLDRRRRVRRELVPIEAGQRTAVVRLYLMEPGSGGVPTPRRVLREFRVDRIDREVGDSPRIGLSVAYSGWRRLDVAIDVAGRPRERAAVPVPLRVPPAAWVTLLALLLVAAAIGLWNLRRTAADTGAVDPAASRPPEVSRDSESAGDGGAAGRAPDEPAGDRRESPAEEPAPVEPAVDEPATVEPPVDAPVATGDDDAAPTESALFEPFSETVYFAPDRVYITTEARRVLDRLAADLRRRSAVSVRIVGHAALFGSDTGREVISRGRAVRVAEYLRSRGWEPRREPRVEWVGARDPVTRDRSDQYRNRRVEITVEPRSSARSGR